MLKPDGVVLECTHPFLCFEVLVAGCLPRSSNLDAPLHGHSELHMVGGVYSDLGHSQVSEHSNFPSEQLYSRRVPAMQHWAHCQSVLAEAARPQPARGGGWVQWQRCTFKSAGVTRSRRQSAGALSAGEYERAKAPRARRRLIYYKNVPYPVQYAYFKIRVLRNFRAGRRRFSLLCESSERAAAAREGAANYHTFFLIFFISTIIYKYDNFYI